MLAPKKSPAGFRGLSQSGRPEPPADDVGVGNEIVWRGQPQLLFLVDPTLRQIERCFVSVLGRALEHALKIRKRRNLFSVFLVTADRPVRKTQRERRIRIIARSLNRKPRLRDLGI